MSRNSNLNMAIRLLVDPTKPNLISNFLLKLNSTDRNNFLKNSTNKKIWIKRWIREQTGYNNATINALVNKHPPANTRNTFQRYINSLNKFKQPNMILNRHMTPINGPPYVTLLIKKNFNNPSVGTGSAKGYIQLEPVCKNNHSKGMYIHFGETGRRFRGQKIGLRLRKVAVNAALNSKILLYQVSQNIEHLVPPGELPISGKIMKSLGAHKINYAPPCRSENLRPQNFAFVVGNKPPKRPIAKRTANTARTLTKRRN